uniref:Uncharacterized protein n=1 Tax=Arion vulgaris TaxID=1028688 RepID=A0A0B7AUQ6_9EUPU
MGGQHTKITSQDTEVAIHLCTCWSAGNKCADFLANSAQTQAGRSMDRADVIIAVQVHLCYMGKSWTLARELGV